MTRLRLGLLPVNLWSLVWHQWFSYAIAAAGFLAVTVQAGRLLGLSGFGYFVTAVATYTVVGQIGLLGTHRIGLRDAALARDRTDTTMMERLVAQASVVSRVQISALAVLVFAGVSFAPWGPAGAGRMMGALVGALLVWIVAHQRLWSCLLRGLGGQRSASLLDGPSGGPAALLTQAVLLAGYGLTTSHGSLVVALGLMAVGQAPWSWLARRQARRRASVPAGTPLPVTALRTVLAGSWRFSVIQAAAFIGASVELWVAAPFVAASDLSLLGAAQRLSLAAVTPLTAMQIMMSPVIARGYARGDVGEMRRILGGGGAAALYASLPLLLPLLLVPGLVLALLFGGAFRAGALLLALLTLGQLANVATGLCGPLLSMTGHESTIAAVLSGTLLARVVIEVPAAIWFGVEGVVIAGAALTTVSWLALLVLAKRRTGVSACPSIRPQAVWALRTVAE